MTKPRQAKQGFNHMGEALTGRHFHMHARVSVARIPPVVPYIRLDNNGLTLAKSARPSAAFHGQFTFKNGEAFDDPWMAVFADDPSPDKCEQFGDRAALRVLMRKLKNRARSPETGFSQTSPIWIGERSGGPCKSGCDMRPALRPRWGISLKSEALLPFSRMSHADPARVPLVLPD